MQPCRHLDFGLVKHCNYYFSDLSQLTSNLEEMWIDTPWSIFKDLHRRLFHPIISIL